MNEVKREVAVATAVSMMNRSGNPVLQDAAANVDANHADARRELLGGGDEEGGGERKKRPKKEKENEKEDEDEEDEDDEDDEEDEDDEDEEEEEEKEEKEATGDAETATKSKMYEQMWKNRKIVLACLCFFLLMAAYAPHPFLRTLFGLLLALLLFVIFLVAIGVV